MNNFMKIDHPAICIKTIKKDEKEKLSFGL